MRLLLGYDGSACGDAAIEDLRRAGLPTSGEAIVMSVADFVTEVPYAHYASPALVTVGVPPVVGEGARQRADRALGEARDLAGRGIDALRSVLPRWDLRAETVADSPYWALIARGEQWGADLVVVGSHGRSALGRLMMGSVSQTVLGYSRCSVRVGRCRDGAGGSASQSAAGEPVRLLLGIDGSEDSAAACEAVRTRPWPTGTEVRLVTAVDLKLLSTMTTFGVRLDRDDRGDPLAAFRRRVDATAGKLREAGLSAVGVVLEGNPKRVLLDEAERSRADCIFLGAKGHNLIDRFLLGSVSATVAARAHCSVEVVRSR